MKNDLQLDEISKKLKRLKDAEKFAEDTSSASPYVLSTPGLEACLKSIKDELTMLKEEVRSLKKCLAPKIERPPKSADGVATPEPSYHEIISEISLLKSELQNEIKAMNLENK